MKTILMISALVCAVAGRPQLLTTNFAAAPYAFASAPLVTYEHNIIPDTELAPAVSFAPVVLQPAAVPVDIASQYHTQDEFGQFTFGHASLGQAHQQTRDFTGAVRGSYTYVDPEGEQVVAHYIADAGGFRVSSNALPVAPTFDGVAPVAPVADLQAPVFDLEAPVFDLEAPVFDLEQVLDTEEVAAAAAEHFRLVEEHKALVAVAALAEAETRAAETETPVVEEPVIVEEPEIIVEAPESVTEALEAAPEPVTEALEAVVVEEVPVEEVEEVVPVEVEPVEPAPLDAEGNVIDTDEVSAVAAEHFRLIEEHKAAVAAALAAATAEDSEEE
ncbi:unnamed protein product [Meganyctiphanes norvegica]|uniref:Cuticle protein n=1 Tax=Meganyctiphanes norvegica TaxID=48144 RepID=A0AAV2PHW1_MEGNR